VAILSVKRLIPFFLKSHPFPSVTNGCLHSFVLGLPLTTLLSTAALQREGRHAGAGLGVPNRGKMGGREGPAAHGRLPVWELGMVAHGAV